MQERDKKREDGNLSVNKALESRAQAEQDLVERFISALDGHSHTLEEQLVGDATQFDSLKDTCGHLCSCMQRTASHLHDIRATL